MWSQPVKDRLLAHAKTQGAPLVCNDSLGSSEGVGFASKQSAAGAGTDTQTATFTLGPNAAVFTEDGRRVQPGSGEKGLLAVGGPIPLGYYGDPVKSAETFKEIEGKRWSIPGDWAEVAADETITLLGRGSVSINTGGEKVYPEEVEECLKLHPSVRDAAVVGLPDEKWGEAINALIELHPGAELDAEALRDHVKAHLAAYKAPKRVVDISTVGRAANGKLDYKALKAFASE
jgi:acyl-CoA synthetase (AMP-forming)/AMP-acid ligase II